MQTDVGSDDALDILPWQRSKQKDRELPTLVLMYSWQYLFTRACWIALFASKGTYWWFWYLNKVMFLSELEVMFTGTQQRERKRTFSLENKPTVRKVFHTTDIEWRQFVFIRNLFFNCLSVSTKITHAIVSKRWDHFKNKDKLSLWITLPERKSFTSVVVNDKTLFQQTWYTQHTIETTQ